jgi:hypothetical protein
VDLLAFLLPFAAWVALISASFVGKSLGNLAEPIYFSFAIPVAALLRAIAGAQFEERTSSIGLVILLSLIAACFYSWTPPLPE